MNILSKLISPKASLNILTKAIEMELKFSVDNYTMVYDANKKEIYFDIPVTSPNPSLEGGEKIRRYPYVNKTFDLPSAIEALTKKEIKTGAVIDLVKLKYEYGNYHLSLYYRDSNGEKLLSKKQL